MSVARLRILVFQRVGEFSPNFYSDPKIPPPHPPPTRPVPTSFSRCGDIFPGCGFTRHRISSILWKKQHPLKAPRATGPLGGRGLIGTSVTSKLPFPGLGGEVFYLYLGKWAVFRLLAIYQAAELRGR